MNTKHYIINIKEKILNLIIYDEYIYLFINDLIKYNLNSNVNKISEVFFFNVSELMFIFRVLNFYIIFSLFFILLNNNVVKTIIRNNIKIVIKFFFAFSFIFSCFLI